jgi:non-heme chloroperoxidase
MQRRNFMKATALVGGILLAPAKAQTRAKPDLFVRDWGSGNPVMFVSGWALGSDFWNYQMLPMSDQGLRCVAFDRRGHGRSSDPGGGYDFDTLAADLHHVIESRNLRGVTLVGHSMGCGEIIRYLSKFGNTGRVTKIALVAPTTPCLLKSDSNPTGINRALIEAVRAAMTKDFPKWVQDNTAPFVVRETSPEMIRWVHCLMNQTSFQALLECNRANIEADFRSELKSIRVPAIVIHGDRDASAPLDLCGRRTAALIPGSKLMVYEGAPHGIVVTHHERLTRDLLAFVKG